MNSWWFVGTLVFIAVVMAIPWEADPSRQKEDKDEVRGRGVPVPLGAEQVATDRILGDDGPGLGTVVDTEAAHIDRNRAA